MKVLWTIFLLLIFIFSGIPANLYAEEEDTDGPKIRLTAVEPGEKEVIIKGFAEDGQSNIKFMFYRMELWNVPSSEVSVKPEDGKLDEKREEFTLSVSLPEDDNGVYIAIFDEADNLSALKVDMYKREDYFGYLTYLSPSALAFDCIEHDDVFKIYYPSNMDTSIITAVTEKMSSLKKLTQENFGMKYYDAIHILLYYPLNEGYATFSDYRGEIYNRVFTFPLEVNTPEDVKKMTWTLDGWIPHELGDHSTRRYFTDEFECGWLSEGIGDLLEYLYQKENYPGHSSEVYMGRIELFKENSGDVKTVNLLDGEWGHEYYLCSVAFIADIYKKHGTGIFKELFKEYNNYSEASLPNDEAIKIFSEILGYDIRPVLENYSTEEAIKVLGEFSKE